jgi:hypothetical protein
VGLRVFLRCLRHRELGRHSTPERVLCGNLRLAQANLLKPKRLREKSRHPVAVQQPEVTARELVDS